MNYLSTTWYDPRVETRASRIHGLGMFANKPIRRDEIVVRIGGQFMTTSRFRAYVSTVRRYNAVQIGEDAHLVDVNTPSRGMNHSCEGNLWMSDEVTIVASRGIDLDEELTQDYALYSSNPQWVMKPCHCGTRVCRGEITGNDWQREDLQRRYKDHFSPFLNERIRLSRTG